MNDWRIKVSFPEKGSYRIWVRTRDWVAPWKKADTPVSKRAKGTPGIFEVQVNGRTVGTFGNKDEKWHWQDGGTIEVTKRNAAFLSVDVGVSMK